MKTTIAKRKLFVEAVCKGLLELGATKVTDQSSNSRTMELNSIVGKLTINVDAECVYTYTVFSRFEDVDRAKGLFACNPFSGKYNFHIGVSDEMTPEKAAEIVVLSFKDAVS